MITFDDISHDKVNVWYSTLGMMNNRLVTTLPIEPVNVQTSLIVASFLFVVIVVVVVVVWWLLLLFVVVVVAVRVITAVSSIGGGGGSSSFGSGIWWPFRVIVTEPFLKVILFPLRMMLLP